MRRSLCLLLLSLTLTTAAQAQSQRVRATRPDGSAVWLHPDGTWTNVGEEKPGTKAASVQRTRPANATEQVVLLKNVNLSLDPAKWRRSEASKPGRLQFTHVNGDGYALVIAERIQMNLDSLVVMAVSNAQEFAPDAHLVSDERRMVNGTEVRCLQIAFTTQGIAFRYFGYYYAGPAGTVQAITYTSEGLLPEFLPDFEAFLDGLEIAR